MIHHDIKDGIAVLRLEHGKVSALDSELLDAIRNAFEMSRDDDTRAVVLTGTGKAFSAGVDLIRMLEEGDTYVDGFLERLSSTLYHVFTFPKPVVAAINGHAIAGGCVMASACDYRIMVEGPGNIGVTELQVGVPFPSIALEIMRSVMSDNYVKRFVSTGLLMHAKRALGYGLVNEAVREQDLMRRATEFAAELAQIPPAAYALTKKQMHEPYVRRHERLRYSHDVDVAEVWKASETHDTIRAYLKKVLGK